MKLENLIYQIKNKHSFLCIGLDTDINKIPKYLLNEDDPIFSFNKSIIDHTNKYCVAYKVNTAFYESLGAKGWVSMKKTVDYINSHYPEMFTIADAKRGDIGNTSKMYAQSFFTEMNFDSVTINPYMGSDSVKPFLEFENRIAILLGLTSNIGANDIQLKTTNNDEEEETTRKTPSRPVDPAVDAEGDDNAVLIIDNCESWIFVYDSVNNTCV